MLKISTLISWRLASSAFSSSSLPAAPALELNVNVGDSSTNSWIVFCTNSSNDAICVWTRDWLFSTLGQSKEIHSRQSSSEWHSSSLLGLWSLLPHLRHRACALHRLDSSLPWPRKLGDEGGRAVRKGQRSPRDTRKNRLSVVQAQETAVDAERGLWERGWGLERAINSAKNVGDFWY